MLKIPLYNCYWCSCGWCLKRAEVECFDRCILCIKLGKMKVSEYCDKYIENTKINPIPFNISILNS